MISGKKLADEGEGRAEGKQVSRGKSLEKTSAAIAEEDVVEEMVDEEEEEGA